MKKLTAILFACMMIASTFTACGDKDDDDDGSSKKKNKTTSTASVDDDDDDEDETEPTTKKKKPTTTEASTDEDETEPTTKKKKPATTEAASDEFDSDLVGKWLGNIGGQDGGFVFEEDGSVGVLVDLTGMMYFEGDKLVADDEEYGPDDYEFDGTNFRLEEDGMEVLNMKKVEGSKKDLDGKYEIVSGYFYDVFNAQFKSVFSTDSFGMIVDGEELSLCFNDCFKITADGDTMKVVEGSGLMGDNEVTYTIKGSKLTMTNEESGQEIVLTKK